MDNTVVIELTTHLTDDTARGAASAIDNVSKLEKAMQKAQSSVDKMRKMSKIEFIMYAVDKASNIMNSVWNLGKGLAGKVFSFTLKAVDLVTAPVQGIMNFLANPIMAAASIAGITFSVGDTINTFMDFEHQMSAVAATAMASQSELQALTGQARKLGAETAFSAIEVAQGMENLASAGFSVDEILKTMPGLLNLAAASGEDLARSSEIAAGSLRGFGLDVSGMENVADVLARAAADTNASVGSIGESLQYIAPNANAAGISFENTVAAIGLLANNMKDGSSAGTGLTAILTSITERSGEASKLISKLGINFFDAEGNAKDFTGIVSETEKALAGMNHEQKLSALETIFGTQGGTAMNILLNETSDKLASITDGFYDVTGAAQTAASIRMDNLKGTFEELGGAVDDFKLSIGEKAEPYLRQFASWLTNRIPSATEAAIMAFDWAEDKIKGFCGNIKEFTGTDEWANADFFGRIGIAWDKLIAEPFGEWWDGTGKAKVAGIAQDIGSGIGSAIKWGISALFGLDINGVIDDGLSIGKSFSDGFAKGIEGIDWNQVLSNLWDAITWGAKNALSLAFSNPITETLAVATGVVKSAQGVAGITNAVKSISNIAKTPLIGATGSSVGGTALTTAGIKGAAATGASTLGTVAAAVGGVVLGVAGVASAISDFNKANKTYNDNLAEKVSGGVKLGMVGAGAAIGTAIAPGIGTAIGAGIGGLAALIGGSSVGDTIASMANGTFMIDKRAADLQKTSDEFDKVIEKSEITKSALEDYYTAAETLSQKGIDESARIEAIENQKNALSNLMDIYGNFINLHDLEHDKLEKTLGYYADIDEARKLMAITDLEKSISDREGQLAPTITKINEAKRNITGFENQLLTLNEGIPGATSLYRDWYEYDEKKKYGLEEDGELDGLIERTKNFSSETGITGIKFHFSDFSSGRAVSLIEEEMNKINASIKKEQEFIDKYTGQMSDLYNDKLKVLSYHNGGSLEELYQQLEEAQQIRSTIDPDSDAGLTKEQRNAIMQISELEKTIRDVEDEVETLNRQFSLVPEKMQTKFEIEIVVKGQEKLDEMKKFFQNNPSSLSAFDFMEKYSDDSYELPDGFGISNEDTATQYWWETARPRANGGIFGAYANGGILDKRGLRSISDSTDSNGVMSAPHIGLVGEDGAEAIIPLSGNRRQRGLSLWEKAGEMLGVKPYANGGIIGTPVVPNVAPIGGGGSGAVVPVTIEEVHFDIAIDGNTTSTDDIVKIIKDNIKNLTDEIAYNLAEALQQQMANTPLSAWEG